MEQRKTLRLILYVFMLTFIVARITVFLIMDRLIPDMYLHVSGTHVHHLNYGIFLLSISGGVVLVRRPIGFEFDIWTVMYAIGLALTFDEFGMWLHLGGPYWQRASFDAVVLIAALLALLAYSPHVSQWTSRRWMFMLGMGVALGIFGVLFANSLKHAKEKLTWKLQSIEALQPE